MPEPARHLSQTEPGSRSSTGPLRDWLAAMKAQAPLQGVEAAALRAEPVRQEPSWSPRLVEVAPPPATMEDPDLSELMAENLMLKAKLQLEADRFDSLQAMLTQEVRGLYSHVREEMAVLEGFRAEREQIVAEREALRAERARLDAECVGLRNERDCASAERESLRGERDQLREDGELWRARAEALAQPLFQIRR